MSRHHLTVPLSAALASTAACGQFESPPGFASSPLPVTTLGGSSSEDSSDSDSSSSSSSDDSTTGGAPANTTSTDDTSATGSTTTPPDFAPDPVGCKGKIDFLFVISSWYSMKFNQDQLQEAFPAFIDIVRKDLADFDYHIMVVDAGGTSLLENQCWQCYGCTESSCTGPGCVDFGGPPDYPCQGPFEQCDTTSGAGVTITGNWNASNQRCLMATENRYLTTADAPHLQETFECITSVGEGPKEPVAMESMVNALDPQAAGATCNSGFVRDDALLAVVILQGDQDNESQGTPEKWYESVVTAKQGDENAVVVLVLSNDKELPDPVCEAEAIGDNPLRLFAETAAHGRFGSICMDSYVPFLTEGAELIRQQCSLLNPQ
jgi:hypothetical protein